MGKERIEISLIEIVGINFCRMHCGHKSDKYIFIPELYKNDTKLFGGYIKCLICNEKILISYNLKSLNYFKRECLKKILK